ncbi:hypothetical protein VP1G_11072 [Cytospora mali]|uniref:Uncharacterized protein n=1 Tax=Cytospora mali TaxID=578113 RepID=A0A194V5S8_CYTMA|nr:hypothetical protein VP1G_11072 [Valsa mali var. pyri (nom. inval.)]
MEESHLLGLYGGVFKAFEVSAPQVHTWRQSGELTKRIIELFSEREKGYQGSYYPWFLRNQHLLNESTPLFDWNGRDNPLIQAIESARPYLSAEDRNKLPSEIQPSAKRDCFLFYAMALNSFHPSPDDELDIWSSWIKETASVKLLVMAEGASTALWRLKHFLALERHTSQREFPGMDAAVREFGFDGSLDAKTQTLLTDFYKRLLGVGDPLRIQEARDCGKLLSYARSLDGRVEVEDEVIQVLQKLS